MGMTTHTRPNLKSPPLRRGTACLACRKRKSRCDGAHPVCKQCVKSHREDQCVYGDQKRKSRTQQLREKVTILRDRVHVLEYETTTSAHQMDYHIGLYSSPEDDYFSQSAFPPELSLSSSSSTSTGSPSSTTLEMMPSTELSPFHEQDVLDITAFSDEFNPLSDPSFFTQLCQWDPRDPFSSDNKQLLVDIYHSHRHQCWFDSCHERPLTELGTHHTLMNVVYLLGCHQVKNSSYFAKLESVFLNRALQTISSALSRCDSLIDVARASALLSVYFYSTGKVVDGYRHSFSAARLAVGLGLHQIYAPELSGFSAKADAQPNLGASVSETAPIPLQPPQDPSETGDRVAAFWQIFMVDHCWSAASGFPTVLPDTMDTQAQIKTPWPIINSHDSSLPFAVSYGALKVRAALLYERSAALAAGPQTPNDPNYWPELVGVSNAVRALQNHLPPVQGYVSGDNSGTNLDALFTNTLLLVCTIHIQKNSDPTEAFHAAQQAVSLIRHLVDTDYELIDPLFAVWWNFVANTYIASIRGSASTRLPFTNAEDDLRLVLHALRSLGKYVPLAVSHGQQIEEEFSILSDAHIPSQFFEGTSDIEYPGYSLA